MMLKREHRIASPAIVVIALMVTAILFLAFQAYLQESSSAAEPRYPDSPCGCRSGAHAEAGVYNGVTNGLALAGVYNSWAGGYNSWAGDYTS